MKFLLELKGTAEEAGGGNATVPNDAPIQPAQAFVDSSVYVLEHLDQLRNGLILLNSMGIVSISGDQLLVFQNLMIDAGNGTVRFINNNLDQSTTNAIFHMCEQAASNGVNGGEIDVSGGTNPQPTGGSLNTDWRSLEDNFGWTVSTN